eukprot:653426-Pyramimonas_sp.AAC.1
MNNNFSDRRRANPTLRKRPSWRSLGAVVRPSWGPVESPWGPHGPPRAPLGRLGCLLGGLEACRAVLGLASAV